MHVEEKEDTRSGPFFRSFYRVPNTVSKDDKPIAKASSSYVAACKVDKEALRRRLEVRLPATTTFSS